MNKHRLLNILFQTLPHCNGHIPEELYWECKAEGIDPEVIYQMLQDQDEEGLKDIYESGFSEDLMDKSEDLFRLEVLQDLEAEGIEYVDGQLYIQAETHNS